MQSELIKSTRVFQEFEKSFIHRNTEVNFGGNTKRKQQRKSKKYK